MAAFTAAGKPPRLLAFIDLPGGELDDGGKGLLSESARLAGTLGADWGALCFGPADDNALAGFAPYGVPAVTVIETAADIADCPEVQGRLLAAAVRELGASLLFLPHNDLGSALAPLVTAELQAALLTEAVAFEACDKGLKIRRPALGQHVAEARIWDGSVPLVLTMSTRVMSTTVLPSVRRSEPQVSRWRPTAAPGAGATRIVERIPADPQTVDVSEAEVIFSAGLGCNRQSFDQLQELTRLLNVSLGATRPVYDLGWTGFERMVGQTGKTVAPRLYVALGISGSMHHLGGIKEAKTIVAVNSDPKVPIFPNADEGFVADLREVLPLLLQRVKSAVEGAA